MVQNLKALYMGLLRLEVGRLVPSERGFQKVFRGFARLGRLGRRLQPSGSRKVQRGLWGAWLVFQFAAGWAEWRPPEIQRNMVFQGHSIRCHVSAWEENCIKKLMCFRSTDH